MNVRAYALSLIHADTLAGKLHAPPPGIDDTDPGPALRIEAPTRPAALEIRGPFKVPPPQGMSDPSQRARIVHALANHELQAAELFAWALVAFPAAPAPFRRGLLAILAEEQRHCCGYIGCLRSLGLNFGDLPVSGHFWHKLSEVRSPLDFVCTMGMTFENANLDFASEYTHYAKAAGDEELVRVLAEVHEDEIGHVRFAWKWLNKLKPADMSPWQAYTSHIKWPLGPSRARGKRFDEEARRAAGFDDEFVAQLAATAAKRPSGAPR